MSSSKNSEHLRDYDNYRDIRDNYTGIFFFEFYIAVYLLFCRSGVPEIPKLSSIFLKIVEYTIFFSGHLTVCYIQFHKLDYLIKKKIIIFHTYLYEF